MKDQPLEMRVRGLICREVAGEPWAVDVQSRRGSNVYRVDFADHEHFGAAPCTCADFAFRRWPDFRKTQHCNPCDHALSAGLFLSIKLAAQHVVLSAQESE